MRDLKKLLMETDEEYLIGLSNKGTVKRARKDMETIKAGVVTVAGDDPPSVGGERVQLSFQKCMPSYHTGGFHPAKRVGWRGV